MSRVELFNHECLPVDIHRVDSRVVQVDIDFFTHDLSLVAPGNRVAKQRDFLLSRMEHHGVGHGLHILAVSPRVKIGMKHAVSRVSFQVVGIHVQRVGMEIKRILTLRKVACQCIFGSDSLAGQFVVPGIIARKQVLVLFVQTRHILKSLHNTRFFVVVHGVALHDAVSAVGFRPFVKFHLLVVRIVKSMFGIERVGI